MLLNTWLDQGCIFTYTYDVWAHRFSARYIVIQFKSDSECQSRETLLSERAAFWFAITLREEMKQISQIFVVKQNSAALYSNPAH